MGELIQIGPTNHNGIYKSNAHGIRVKGKGDG